MFSALSLKRNQHRGGFPQSRLLNDSVLVGQARQYLRSFFGLDNPDARQVWVLFLPIWLGSLLGQVYIVVERALASGLAEGSLAALSFADKLRQLPLGLFVAAISTVLFPTLSELSAKGDKRGLEETLSSGLRLVALITVPAAFGLAMLREPIVRLLFERGAFDASSTATTAAVVLYYSIGIIALAANSVMTFTYYGMQDTVTPVVITGKG